MLLAAWDRLELGLIGILTLLSLLLSFYAMVSRYIAPQYALDWTTEVVVYLITWAFLLAGARAVAGADHVKADLITNFLSSDVRKYLAVLQDFISLLFCIVVMVGGIQVVGLSLHLYERSDSSLSMPMWIYYLCLPIAFASIAIRYSIRLTDSIRALRQDQVNGEQ